ncbi:hypothetical protein [Sphingomonas bacterium]|uniref:hypothetical protein n=1 Tax=Sphingomonas bacterium TaxID=1895847 RepID=UPI001575C49D|nr:hypothetical protein [Sphingomonas bacterium]
MARRDPGDGITTSSLLERGETVLYFAPATRRTLWAGLAPIAWAVPMLAVGWWITRWAAGALGGHDRSVMERGRR